MRPPVAWAVILKDALLAAVVAILLALPLVGLQTYDIGGGALGIRTHFDWVALGAAAVFAGRLAWRCASCPVLSSVATDTGSRSSPSGAGRCGLVD